MYYFIVEFDQNSESIITSNGIKEKKITQHLYRPCYNK